MNKYFLFLIILISALSSLAAQDLRQTKIDKILINNKVIEESNWNDLVLTTQDSINFEYHLVADEDSEKTPFLFRIILDNGETSYNRVYNTRKLKYKKMAENTYTLQVEAFDPRGKWKATTATLVFRVNNRDAQVRRSLDSMYTYAAKQDSTSLALRTEIEKNANYNSISLYGNYALLFIIFVILLVAFIWLIKYKKQKKNYGITLSMLLGKEDKKKIKELLNRMNNITPEKLQENKNLKDEVIALRNQMDILQRRSSELTDQNKDLSEQVGKLSNKKSELEELQNQKDELFSVIMHDIKNPAALIKSLVELLSSYDLTANEQQEIMKDIFDTTQKIFSLSQEVSRIMTLESGELHLEKDKVQMNDIVQDVFRLNKVAADKKDMRMLIEMKENLPDILVDPQKIGEVLDNLISNAIKYTNNKGTVQVRTENDNGWVTTHISDNGQGLSESDIKKAFQRGSKLSAKPTGGESSTGLGLWIVKKIVDAHGGRVWVKSSLGKGSTFSISFPKAL